MRNPDGKIDPIVKWRWPDGIICCPKCASDRVGPVSSRNRFKCRDCRSQFSATSGTIFASAKLSPPQIVAAIGLLAGDAPAVDISRLLGIQYSAAWLLRKRHLNAKASTGAPRT